MSETPIFEECQKLIKHAYRITTGIDEEIPWEYNYWNDILGNMEKAPDLGGSLYKCAKCWDDLPERTVELMKQHAKSKDVHFYILCRKCGGQAEFEAGVEFDEIVEELDKEELERKMVEEKKD